MASNVTIQIEAPRGTDLPLRSKVQEYASLVGLDLDSADSYTVLRLIDAPARILIEWWDRKWGVDEATSFAAAVSEELPELEVRYVEEWGNRDADESGAEGFDFKAGKLIRKGSMQMVWEDLKS